jgi:hypothetical protein
MRSQRNLKKGFMSKLSGLYELNHASLIFSFFVLAGFMIVITLSSSGTQLTKGHVLNMLERDHQELIRLNEINDTEISKIRTLSFIKDSGHVQGMRTPSVVMYVNGDTVIAKN